MLKQKTQTITEIISKNNIFLKSNFRLNWNFIFDKWWKYFVIFLITYIVSAANTFYLYIVFEDGLNNLENFGVLASSLFSVGAILFFITIELNNVNYNNFLKKNNSLNIFVNKFFISYLIILSGTLIFMFFIFIIGKYAANYQFDKDFLIYSFIHSVIFLTVIYWIFVMLAFYFKIRTNKLIWFYIVSYSIFIVSIIFKMIQILLNNDVNFYIQNILMYIPFLNITFMDYSKVEPLVISNYWTYGINFMYAFIFIVIDTIKIKKISNNRIENFFNS